MVKRKRNEKLPWSKKRKGQYWSRDEQNHLIDSFESWVVETSKEHGRTKNAIMYRIFKTFKEDNECSDSD